MFRIFVIAFSIFFHTTTIRAEPQVCRSVIMENGKMSSPFMMLDVLIVETYISRAVCGLDVNRELRFWRSYYKYYGCSPESEYGAAVEEWLIKGPGWRQAEFEQFKQEKPAEARELCEKARNCVVPDTYDPDGSKIDCRVTIK